MRISAQLYTVRQCGDLGDQLRLASACGFTDVETTGLHGLTAHEIAETIRCSGLTVRSAHFDWEEFEDRFEDITLVLELLRCPVAVMPWLTPEARPDTAQGWMAVSGRLADWANRLAKHDVKLAYHNHDFDLVGSPDHTPLDLILEEEGVYWQPDIGWLAATGLDPAVVIRRYAGKVVSVHAKDADPTKTGDERWRDLGDGVVDWSTVLKALRCTDCTDLFVEHDETTNHRRTLTTGRRFLKQQLGEVV